MNVLLINGGKKFINTTGELNDAFIDIMKKELISLNHEIKETYIDKGYTPEEEIQKIAWADTVIHQMPLWWMGEPWIVKEYVDNVFLNGILFKDDGRTRSDPTKTYGSGGLSQGKKVMLSITMNAPKISFEDKNQFFEGKSVDELFFHFHKAHHFLGFTSLPGFVAYDVIKNPNFAQWEQELKSHIKKYF